MQDIHDFPALLARAMERLELSPLPAADKAAITRFVDFKATRDKIGIARQEKYLRLLRVIAEEFIHNMSFTAIKTEEDVMRIVSEIDRSKLSGWTKHDYQLFLKTFLTWLGKADIVNWIRLPIPKSFPDEILTEVEIQAMIDAAQNLRDKAFIAMLYEGGFRIGEIGGLRIKDISFDRYGAIAVVTGKTGVRRVRIIWASPYIAQWLEVHPLREKREAAVWIKMSDNSEMTYAAMRTQIQRTAARAGIQKRVNPHNFRHSRSTHLASTLTESQMEEYLGWVQGSRMPSIYVHMSGRNLDADLLQMYGLEPEEKTEPELETLQCPHCRTLNTQGARVCFNCRKPLAVEEVADREARAKQMFAEFMDVMEDPALRDKFKEFFNSETK